MSGLMAMLLWKPGEWEELHTLKTRIMVEDRRCRRTQKRPHQPLIMSAVILRYSHLLFQALMSLTFSSTGKKLISVTLWVCKSAVNTEIRLPFVGSCFHFKHCFSSSVHVQISWNMEFCPKHWKILDLFFSIKPLIKGEMHLLCSF